MKRSLLAVVCVAVVGAACGDSFEPQYVDAIRILPDSVHIAAGEVATFSPIPVSDRGESLSDRAERVEWSINRPDVASIETTASGDLQATALGLGEARITARLGRGSRTGWVFVQPSGLDHIVIEPSSLTVSDGERPRVEVHLFDAQGNEMDPDGFRISWAIGDTRIGFVGTPTGPRADLLARNPGTTFVRVTVGRMATSITFTVVP